MLPGRALGVGNAVTLGGGGGGERKERKLAPGSGAGDYKSQLLQGREAECKDQNLPLPQSQRLRLDPCADTKFVPYPQPGSCGCLRRERSQLSLQGSRCKTCICGHSCTNEPGLRTLTAAAADTRGFAGLYSPSHSNL